MKKPKKKTCDCRRRVRGNPKLSTGPCYGGYCVREAVRERIAGKKAARRWEDPY